MIELSEQTVTFIAIAIAMTVAAAFFLARPWLRREVHSGVDRNTFTVQVYRDQLAELETDMKEQRLTEDQYAQARHDLEHSMMDDLGRTGPSEPLPPTGKKAPNAGVWALVMVAVSLPILALILYGVLHFSIQAITPAEERPETAENQTSTGQDDTDPRNAAGVPFSIDEMVGRLAARLEANPEDAKGWAMLGRSYTVMKRYTESRDAYARSYQLRANELQGVEDAEMVANYAEAISRTEDNTVGPEVTQLMEQALELDPDNQKALWFGGMGAFHSGEYRLATARWQRLQTMIPEDSPISQPLAGAIEEARVRSGDLQLEVPEEETAPGDAAAASDAEAAIPDAQATATPSALSGQPR